jgi:hypothetical protein
MKLATTSGQRLKQRNFKAITDAVGLAVADILDAPPIAMLKKELPPEDHDTLDTFLMTQLTLLAEQVNIDSRLNLQAHQIPAIASQLIETYPTETLEDFVFCFRRGALGFYGQIFRLDAAVLTEWMGRHLDEKYQQIETRVQNLQVKTTKENEVNYEAFKARAEEVFAKENTLGKVSHILNDADYVKRRFENPYKYFKVLNVEVYATSQLHAEELVEAMIKRGELILEEHEEEKKNSV